MIADILVVAIVAIFISIGYKAGLMKALIKVVSYVLSIIVAFIAFPHVSDFLTGTEIYEFILKKVSESSFLKNNLTNEYSGVFFKYIQSGIENATDGIATAITELLINIVAFVLVLILSRLIMLFLCKVLNVFSRLPIIKQFNRLGGGIFGGITGVVVLYVVFAIFVVFAPLKTDSIITKEIEKSSFAIKMYENNVLLDFIGKAEIGGANGNS